MTGRNVDETTRSRFDQLCARYDVLLSDEGARLDGAALSELRGLAHIYDLDTEIHSDPTDMWLAVRPVLSDQEDNRRQGLGDAYLLRAMRSL